MLQDVVGEADKDWLAGVLDGAGQPIPRPRSPLQEVVGVSAAEVVGQLDDEDEDDGEGHPIPSPKSPLQGVVVGEGDCEAEPVAVGEVAGDVVGLLDEAGQPIPKPKRPAHEDVGVVVGGVV